MTQGVPQQAAQETEMSHELLNRMIDDRLEERAADQARLGVAPQEVDRALKHVADQARITVRDLIVEANRQGLTEQDYRDEIRRQVLEGKLIELRVRGHVHVTEEDARASYRQWLREYEARPPVDVRTIAMRIPPGASDAAIDTQLRLADQIVARARSGQSFCKLVNQYSPPVGGIHACGDTGPQPIDALQARSRRRYGG